MHATGIHTAACGWRSRFAVAVTALAALNLTCHDRTQGPGEITGTRLPAPVVEARAVRQRQAVAHLASDGPPPKQILFGDLHVHTTFSMDAFFSGMPFMQGEGSHPPADACDFARYCSDLDFFSLNDHAEGITHRMWEETKQSIRQCNALAGDPANPDLVAYVGWEWTQMGATPAEHYGHKNVIFKDLEDDRLPARPINAQNVYTSSSMMVRAPLWRRAQLLWSAWKDHDALLDLNAMQAEIAGAPVCPAGVPVRELPPDCLESAPTPDVLFEKLAQWGFDSIVSPHGTTWGLYTPPGATIDKQLTPAMHDPQRQILFEIYSGHGNSEEYRPWHEIDYDAAGAPVCPAPTPDYVPCCWQAGEIIRARCAGASAAECERRVAAARRNFLDAGVSGVLTVPGATANDWKDCGQCRDCFLPAFSLRPGNSAQRGLAISHFAACQDPLRFRFGFIASSDNHTARPGTGYKEYARQLMTEVAGPENEAWMERLRPRVARGAESIPIAQVQARQQGVINMPQWDFERQASYFMTGGLVAVHAAGRDRDAIWQALKRREVYATSGPRILLWFDLLAAAGGAHPMGSEATVSAAPRFRVRAAGAFKQRPGCPEHSHKGLSPERLERLCRGECYHPSDERYQVKRIEVVRIRAQRDPQEAVAGLIDDPWRRFECPPDPAGCVVEFDDPELVTADREVAYYVRAVQEATPAVNAGGIRCTYDATGQCTAVNPCYGDFRTPSEDDCLAPSEERAWSSPIWVRPQPPHAASGRPAADG